MYGRREAHLECTPCIAAAFRRVCRLADTRDHDECPVRYAPQPLAAPLECPRAPPYNILSLVLGKLCVPEVREWPESPVGSHKTCIA